MSEEIDDSTFEPELDAELFDDEDLDLDDEDFDEDFDDLDEEYEDDTDGSEEE